VEGLGFSRTATYFGGMFARRDPVGIRLLTRNGNDWFPRYPLIVEAVNRLKARSCLVDGEAVACDANGHACRACASTSTCRILATWCIGTPVR
jgi:hypothetical protein